MKKFRLGVQQNRLEWLIAHTATLIYSIIHQTTPGGKPLCQHWLSLLRIRTGVRAICTRLQNDMLAQCYSHVRCKSLHGGSFWQCPCGCHDLCTSFQLQAAGMISLSSIHGSWSCKLHDPPKITWPRNISAQEASISALTFRFETRNTTGDNHHQYCVSHIKPRWTNNLCNTTTS